MQKIRPMYNNEKRIRFEKELEEKMRDIEYTNDDDYIDETINVIIELEIKYGVMV